jgi:hypothetical protein
MKCLSKGCKTISLLMTCELCYPCSQLIEHGKRESAPLNNKENNCAECGKKSSDGYALYCVKCSEPMREWVGLTEEDMGFLFPYGKSVWVQETVKIIEAKLKEKNT